MLSPADLAREASRGKWGLAPHLDLLNRALLRVAVGRIKRLLVSMPPRHGKSELTSRYFPAWFLGIFPEKRVILASYEAGYARTWGRRARTVLEELGGAFGVSVSGASRAADAWETTAGGGMVTAGVGGPITGRGADVLIIDDPVKNAEEASSPTYRERAWDWYRSTAHTRLEPGGAIIVIQTRWHDDDLTGRLIRDEVEGGEAWTKIDLPAIAVERDALGRSPGSALWPDRYDVAALDSKRRTLGSYWFSALYQGRPSPDEGGIFKKAWLRTYLSRELPAGGFDFATVDLAVSTKQTADYTVIAVWRYHDRRLYLLDLIRQRLDGPSLVPAIKGAVDRYRLRCAWIESNAFQVLVVTQARAAGVPVRELIADRDKVSRAMAATPYAEAGQVLIPEHAAWRAELEAELLAFPAGAHDDQVDAFVYGILSAPWGGEAGPIELDLPPREKPREASAVIWLADEPKDER